MVKGRLAASSLLELLDGQEIIYNRLLPCELIQREAFYRLGD